MKAKAPTVGFNYKDRPEFFKELRSRVDRYFKDNNISKYGNRRMKIKSAFMLTVYIMPFVLLLTLPITSAWNVVGAFAVMGLGMAGIGLCIMHDANHKSFSKNQKVNNLFSYSLDLIGAYNVTWKIQHNVLHHSFTNIEGFDEDIDNEVMRFSPKQEQKGIYRFQVVYAMFFYGIMTFNKLFLKDFKQISKYDKKGLLATQGITKSKAIFQILWRKMIYFAVMFGLPLSLTDVSFGLLFGSFFLMHFVCGLILALVFQSAHVIEETDFYTVDDNGSVENNWAIHQLRTTANFGINNKLLTWLLGGLNHQVEHHLFPDICHVHYTPVSKIVQETCKEYDIPYINHKTFGSALISHFKFLNRLGYEEINAELSHM